MVERLFLAVPRGCLQFVIVVFPNHTHLLFFINESYNHRYKVLLLYELTCHMASLLYELKFIIMLHIKCNIG